MDSAELSVRGRLFLALAGFNFPSALDACKRSYLNIYFTAETSTFYLISNYLKERQELLTFAHINTKFQSN